MLLSITLVLVCIYNYLFKSLFHKSRPIFDDITLADTTMKDCAVEFGNPSGHSLCVTCIYSIILQIYLDYNQEYYSYNRLKRYMWQLLTFVFIFAVMFSRVYCGRHTID